MSAFDLRQDQVGDDGGAVRARFDWLRHREHALDMYRRVYYDSPLSAQAVDAQSGIERLQASSVISSDLVGRAQRRHHFLVEGAGGVG